MAVVGIQPQRYAPEMQPANMIYISSTSFRADWTDETSDNMVDSYTLEVLPAPLHLLRGSWYPESSYADISLPAPWRGSRVRGGMNVIYFRNSNSQPGSITYTIPDGYTNATFALKITTDSGTNGKGNLTVATPQTAAVSKEVAAGETYSWVVTASSGEKITITSSDENYSPDMALIAVYEGDGTENRIITGITDKSYTVEDLETDGTYQYRVKAIYTNGTESKWSNDEEVTITQKVPYAVLDGTTLTFYYDENKAAWADEVGEANVFFSIPWDIDHSFTNDLPDWTSSEGNTTITTATFDESFGDYGLKSTRCMFYRMTALKTINHLEYLNTENVTDMGYMFDGCSALKTLDLSSFNTSKVTYMGFMFYDCPSLETLNLGDNFNTANVTHMNYMFANCEALKTLDLSNFNTAKVFNMDLMFYNCQALETLDLSNFNTSEVTYMRYMFEDCSSLETIYCAEGTDWSGVESRTYTDMFAGCTKLSGKCGSKEFACDGENDVDGTYAKMYNGTEGGYFTSTTERQAYAVAMPNNPGSEEDQSRTLTFYYDTKKAQRTSETGSYVFSIPWTGEKPGWTNSSYAGLITTAEFDPSFANYHDLKTTANMFNNMASLTAINHLDYLKTENVTDMNYMFSWCQELTELDVSKFNTAQVKDMNHMFYMCTKVEALDVSKFNTSSVENMNDMFGNCYKVGALNVSKFNTSEVKKMNRMFEGCKTVTDLDLSSFNTSKVTDMSFMFANCEELKSVDLSSFNTSANVTDMSYMFNRCKVLENLDLSKLNTSSVKNMNVMFYGCEKLKELDLSKFKTGNVTNMSRMFEDCSLLEEVDLSSFNTSSVTDMSSMFSMCRALKKLDLSNFNTGNVTKMGSMFYDCENLTTIYCFDDWYREDISSGLMFSGCNNLKGAVAFNSTNANDVTYANPTKGYFAPFYDLEVTEAGMATLYLGFQAEIPEGVEVYYCTKADFADDETPYSLAHKIGGSALIANTAVFVKAEPGTYRFKYYYLEPGTALAMIYKDNILTGTLEEKTVEPRSVLTLGYGNKTEKLGFWWFTGTTIPANRAYIPGDKLSAAGVKGITLVFDEETTSLTPNPSPQGEGSWYSIDGRKLEGKPTQKGLYINNGRKVLIK